MKTGIFLFRMDSKMDFQAITSKLRKYPTAAAALVFSSVFSFLLTPPTLLRTIDFYLVWCLSVLFAIHIWCNFKEDRSYRVSGIVPAWIELIIGTVLLFTCPVRELSLIFIMLAICSYAAGIIFSLKVIGPMILFLGVAPKLYVINQTISDVMALIFRNIYHFFTGREPEAYYVIASLFQSFKMPFGTPQLLWTMLLAVFPFAIYMCKTSYERFSMYCFTILVFIVSDLLRYILLVSLPGENPAFFAYWIALVSGVAFIAWFLYMVNHFSKGVEKK